MDGSVLGVSKHLLSAARGDAAALGGAPARPVVQHIAAEGCGPTALLRPRSGTVARDRSGGAVCVRAGEHLCPAPGRRLVGLAGARPAAGPGRAHSEPVAARRRVGGAGAAPDADPGAARHWQDSHGRPAVGLLGPQRRAARARLQRQQHRRGQPRRGSGGDRRQHLPHRQVGVHPARPREVFAGQPAQRRGGLGLAYGAAHGHGAACWGHQGRR
mmetsp:Transcript_114819/g.364869  ORF Transcript_114819/g.364869 Transcript_114819/m.364869 type:complete len:215 (+) Transcript_114819:791-1435(+)